MNDDDIFASAGGSLLNDLLSDLDAAVAASSRPDDPSDDLFASLERELASSYANPPPGMGVANSTRSAAAFVVGHQSHRAAQLAPPSTPGNAGAGSNPDDAWSAALSQFGHMSLAADFLAADTAKKEKQAHDGKTGAEESEILGELSSDVVGKLFDDDDDYDAEEEVVLGGQSGKQSGESNETVDVTGGLMALLGASRANSSTVKEEKPVEVKELPPKELKPAMPSNEIPHSEVFSPQSGPGTKAPPPSPMFPPHPSSMGYPMPPGGPPGPFGMPHPMMLNHPMMMPPPMHMQPHMPPPHMMAMGRGMPPPPNAMHPMMMGPNGHPMQGHGQPPFHGPPHPHGMLPLPAHGNNMPPQFRNDPPPAEKKTGKSLFKNNDFPVLGASPQSEDDVEETKDDSSKEGEDTESVDAASVVEKIMFNNPNPSASPINASRVASSLMPARDVCYIVHSMLRPLQSLDTYSNDYYHWSFIDRKSRNMLMLGGMGHEAMKTIPNPVWKEVKVQAKEREIKYREAVETRAKDWAEEKKSLGRTVRTNVNRPRALLTTPVLHKENIEEDGIDKDGESKVESDYELEQQRNRVQMWKARVAIDKGYTAFLSLTELRRLIQANASAPQLVNDLMSDVKSNVDLMHASFGIAVKMDSDGNRKTEVDKTRLGSTLSLSKGRVLCARVIEGGILPHQSACEILPIALFTIFSTPLPASRDGVVQPPAAGEDRLLRALMGLVLTVQPSVDPLVLCRCLDVSVLVGKENADAGTGKSNLSNITGSRTRMELLHSILSRGKVVCTDSLSSVWAEKEKAFMELLTK